MKKRFLIILVLIISLPIALAECNGKNGGVEVNGNCYDCGEADNVCPEDFGVECKAVDPDCRMISSFMVKVVEWFKSLFK